MSSEDDGQTYVDRSVADIDPADGLLSGTAVDGTSRIPGPHAVGDDTDSADTDGADGDDADTDDADGDDADGDAR